MPARVQERFDLCEPPVDADDRRCALGQQVVAEAASPVHLDQQAAELAQRFLARLQQRAALAPEEPGMLAPRDDSLDIGRAPAEERGHARESS
jgi:hypothetical protein